MTVTKIEKSYTATKDAYDAVIHFDNLQLHEKNQINEDNKDNVIQVYKNNQMPDISEDTFSNGSLNMSVIYLLIKQ